MTNPESIRVLSRFFFASNAEEMELSYGELANVFPGPTVTDWSAVEFSFNRLFVGPGALLAPPYASIYLDGDNARLMGESTLKLRHLYEMLGLVSPWQNKIPDDHIALELDALWQIEIALQSTDSTQLLDVREYLLSHLHAWVPRFTSRIRSVEGIHPAILYITIVLHSAITDCMASTTQPGAV